MHRGWHEPGPLADPRLARDDRTAGTTVRPAPQCGASVRRYGAAVDDAAKRPSSSPRVLHLLNAVHRRGAETFAYDLHQAMQRQGVVSTAVALRAVPRSEPSLPVELVKPRMPGVVGDAFAVRSLLSTSDVVIAHGGRTLHVAAGATLGLKQPFVYRIIGESAAWARGRGARWRVSTLMRRADAVVAYHDKAITDAVEWFGLDPRRCHVIAKGIDLEPYSPATAAERDGIRGELGIGSEPLFVGVGALGPEKDLELAIRSVASLSPAKLALVGTGPESEGLRMLAQREGVDLLLPGAVDSVRQWLVAADVVLLTSRTEGVPGVLIEAAACGTPSVAVDVGGVRHAVLDLVTGRVVEDRDPSAIARALEDAVGMRQEVATAGPIWASENASISDAACKWADLLRSIT